MFVELKDGTIFNTDAVQHVTREGLVTIGSNAIHVSDAEELAALRKELDAKPLVEREEDIEASVEPQQEAA